MRRASSSGGDAESPGLELNDIDLDEREERDLGMRGLGYGGAEDLESMHFRLSTRAKALAAAVYASLNVLFLWLLRGTAGTALHGDATGPESTTALACVAAAACCYALCQWSDPGFANPPDRADPDEGDYAQRKREAAAATERIKLAAATEDAFSTLLPWPAWPPMRAAYCRPARRWVYTYDHYCPFVGNAIGERNRPRFLAFLLAQTAALGRLAAIAEAAVKWADVFSGSERAFFLAAALGVLFLVALGFLAFHAFLALTNMTTNEFLRAHKLDYLHNTEDFDLPFTRGLVGNLRVYFGQDGLVAALCRREWAPTPWVRPAFIDRDSEDWWNNPWQNKYWSCC